jgi:hypothetical protein
LLTDGSWRDVEPFSSSPKMQLFGHRHEVTKMTKLHDYTHLDGTATGGVV